MLDNRHMVLVEDHDVRRYRPIFLVDRNGVKAYSDAPPTSEASRISASHRPDSALGNWGQVPFQFNRLELRMQRREATARREAGEVLTDIARSYNVGHSAISRLSYRPTVGNEVCSRGKNISIRPI